MRCLSILSALGCAVLAASFAHAAPVSLHITDASGAVMPCRVHLRDATGQPVRPPDLPFWFDHFVCTGDVKLDLPAGSYTFTIERGPEHESKSGDLIVTAEGGNLQATVRRIADLARDGWWSGETHVHRPSGLGTRLFSLEDLKAEIALHLRAEDLHIAPVITWWDHRSLWKDGLKSKIVPFERVDENRFYNIMAGEDERGGGALLFFNLQAPLDLPMGGRDHPEYPSSMKFLEQAKHNPGSWVDAEKPFWSDAPMWFASRLVDSVGIANNHMNRSGVRDEEAWGHARDREKFPGPQGNGRWSQQIYYHLLNCGVRLPPSAGSASGVLPNPVGYNRAYVQIDGPLTWDKWFDGLRTGRVFVTNGPLLRVRANGEWPGHVFKQDGTGPLHLKLEATLEGRDPMSQIEIIKNGSVERRVPVGQPLGELEFNESGWFLVRVIADIPDNFRFASTGPFYVEVGKSPRRISRKSAQFFLDWMKDRIANLKVADPAQREESLTPQRKAEVWWRQKVEAATTDE
jgi:hypothetical protein